MKETTKLTRKRDLDDKIKVYIAGSSRQVDRVEKFWERLQTQGNFELTVNWMEMVRRKNRGEHLAMEKLADIDFQGVEDADVVIVLAPPSEAQSIGAWIEMGYALRGRRQGWEHLIVVGSPALVNIWADAEGVTIVTKEAQAAGAIHTAMATAEWRSKEKDE